MAPRLEVVPETVLRKSRMLPTRGEVLVETGETVTPDTVVARGLVPNPDVRDVPVSALLRVVPSGIEKHMLKKEGDGVEEGELIAGRRAFFGLSKYEVRSPIDGTIAWLSEVSGKAFVRGRPIRIEVGAHIPGCVVETEEGMGATLEVSAAFVEGSFGIGGEAHGELSFVVEDPGDAIAANMVREEHGGKILVGGALATPGALNRAVEVGVRGIVCGGVHQGDLMGFLGREIGVGVTGDEDVGLTLIVTEGFGEIPMREEVFSLLRRFSGGLACIDGSTQIRRRMVRPEIVLPLG